MRREAEEMGDSGGETEEERGRVEIRRQRRKADEK